MRLNFTSCSVDPVMKNNDVHLSLNGECQDPGYHGTNGYLEGGEDRKIDLLPLTSRTLDIQAPRLNLWLLKFGEIRGFEPHLLAWSLGLEL